jgi:hypothetical protein
MNTTGAFVGGWAAFAGSVGLGAVIGYQVFAEQHEKNLLLNEQLKRDRSAKLAEIDARWKKERREKEEREIAALGGALQRKKTEEAKAKKKKVEQVLLSSHSNRVGGQVDERKWGD